MCILVVRLHLLIRYYQSIQITTSSASFSYTISVQSLAISRALYSCQAPDATRITMIDEPYGLVEVLGDPKQRGSDVLHVLNALIYAARHVWTAGFNPGSSRYNQSSILCFVLHLMVCLQLFATLQRNGLNIWYFYNPVIVEINFETLFCQI